MTLQSFADPDPALNTQIASRLAAGDLAGFMGVLPNPDPILKAMGQDIKAYRNLLVDPLIMGIRRRRVSAVLSMQRGFDKDSGASPPRVRAAVEKWFKTIDVQQLTRELMDGAFFGYRVGEVMWEQQAGMLYSKLITKPSEWFGFEGEHSELRFKPSGFGKGTAVDPRKFIVVGKMRSWENPYGEPDLAACFWPVTFKRGGMKFWATFTEKYGSPWAVGKLPRTASSTETDDLANKLTSMVRDAVAVIPDDSSVELIQTGGTANAEMYEKLLMFCRSEISIALLGNNQSVEMQSNQASATAARHIEADLRDDDAEMVADGINQLVRLFCQVNFQGVPAPVYRFRAQKKIDQVQAARDEKLQAAGARFTPAYFERVYNLRPGDVVTPAKPHPAYYVEPSSRPAGALASFADAAVVPMPGRASFLVFKLGMDATAASQAVTFTAADLEGMATVYDPAKHEAPLIVGESRHDAPAYGWVSGLRVVDGNLIADSSGVDDEFLAIWKAGGFNRVRASFYTPASSNNPTPKRYYLKGVSFVGADAPRSRLLSFADWMRGMKREREDLVCATMPLTFGAI